MERIILQCLLLIVSLGEVGLCWEFLFCTIIKKECLRMCEKVVIVVSVLILGSLAAINRATFFFSFNILLFCMMAMFVFTIFITRKHLRLLLGLIISYYSFVALIDLFFAFLALIILKQTFFPLVYVYVEVPWGVFIYLISRIIVGICISILTKKGRAFVHSMRESETASLVIGIAILISVRKYQHELDEMFLGERIMNGRASGISLLLVVILGLISMLIVLKNRDIKKENEILVMREQLIEEYYRNESRTLENNSKMVHDMKQHLVILKEYEQSGNIQGLHDYLEEISGQFERTKSVCWTGIKILDIILNQKKAYAEKQGIEVQIQIKSVDSIPLKESEICSLFGNLLDNALEACQRIEEKKWIYVSIEQQNQMLFISIRNSIQEEPTRKGRAFVSTKSQDELHGYGIKSVRSIVKRNGGMIQYRITDKQVCVDISFFDKVN